MLEPGEWAWYLRQLRGGALGGVRLRTGGNVWYCTVNVWYCTVHVWYCTMYNVHICGEWNSIRGDPLWSHGVLSSPRLSQHPPYLHLCLSSLYVECLYIKLAQPKQADGKGGGRRPIHGGDNETTAKNVCGSANVIFPPRACGRVCNYCIIRKFV